MKVMHGVPNGRYMIDPDTNVAKYTADRIGRIECDDQDVFPLKAKGCTLINHHREFHKAGDILRK